MDQLPDLQSDADVDALMARIRARLATPAAPGPAPAPAPELSGSALRDFLATQEECASVMLRTMQLLADTLEELEGGTTGAPAPGRRRGNPAAPRASGRRRKTR
jgi:hypothetical protein